MTQQGKWRLRLNRRSARWMFFSGLGGLVLGIGIAVGAMIAVGTAPQWELLVPMSRLEATASDGAENFVLATGMLSEDIEGVFFLDALSGDLQFTHFNPVSGAFNPPFVRNVATDMQIEAGKKPRYLMVTGRMRAARRPTKTGVAECAVYIVEATSGKFAAYTVPWQDTMLRSGRAQIGELVLLGVGSVRTAAVRE